MNWTRRIIRCAVLHTMPGEDVLDPLAHTLCRFGAWFTENRMQFETLDPAAPRSGWKRRTGPCTMPSGPSATVSWRASPDAPRILMHSKRLKPN
jgi:hypothetical protein